ncbi:MAG: hypothetical protein JJ891_16720 [Rhizobiaceae bacterium]|nr:hypothetical protein [Rhizobiaceae bacterium]
MSRPRGFIADWSPKPATADLIESVQLILDANRDIAPLTLRQIFYMLVSGYHYEKTEKAYKRLCETMNKARRARWVSMDEIRDDGLRREDPDGWQDEATIIDTFKSYADRFRLNRQQNQPCQLIVWCEAGGMLPQLARYCQDFGVSVLSSGGFDSVTTKHNFAKEAAAHDLVNILHIGDHDPSGVHMYSSLDEDLQAFIAYYGGDISVDRIAVTPEQVEEMRLPTAPAKSTDRRAFSGRTTQAEAIPPRRLRDIVTAAIEARMEMDTYEETLRAEDQIRASLSERLARL